MHRAQARHRSDRHKVSPTTLTALPSRPTLTLQFLLEHNIKLLFPLALVPLLHSLGQRRCASVIKPPVQSFPVPGSYIFGAAYTERLLKCRESANRKIQEGSEEVLDDWDVLLIRHLLQKAFLHVVELIPISIPLGELTAPVFVASVMVRAVVIQVIVLEASDKL
jgi:hypothetical protein